MKRILLYLLLAVAALPSSAQKNATFLAYIDTYKDMAIDQMRRHNIPASITLAQGILESAAGQSYLATTANNHFGIKTGASWTGPWVTKDDDKAQEKFRKYATVAESFEDHSRFLHKQRYAKLFDLDPTDYKGWAYGLKEANYATNPKYPTLLINLIEDYELAQYDHQPSVAMVQVNNVPMPAGNVDFGIADMETQTEHSYATNHGQHVITHSTRLCNDVAYVVAREGDSYESIAYEFYMNPDKLRKYNETAPYYQLKAGDLVYLHSKKNHVAPRIRGAFHKVQNGESIHSISQRYGIKMSRLYRWNMLPANFRTNVGDLLLLD